MISTSAKSMIQIVTLGALALVLIAWATTRFLMRNRARSSAARERGIFKERLPDWLKWFELSLLYVFSLLTVAGFFILSLKIHGQFHAYAPGTMALILMGVPDFFFALVFSMFAINFIEWIVPSLRRVNENAMEGLPAASFHQSNKDFLQILKWAGPAGFILWVGGVALR